MENITELVSIINKRKLSQIEILDKSLISRKDTLFAKFYNGIAEGHIKTDRDAVLYIYGSNKDATNYRKLKSRFKERLLNTLYFIDINHAAETDSSKKAYFDCLNHLYLSNILLRYAESRNSSIQLIADSYATAKRNNFFDILKEYSYKLLVHYGMSGQIRKYEEEYASYQQYCKEYELEQKAQLIYTKAMMTVHYAKKNQEDKEKEIKQCTEEIASFIAEAKSLVVYFIYIRTLLFYYEISGNNKKINETCDTYLKHYRKYLSSILSENYLNTIYIYKLKSLFDLRKMEEALSLIKEIVPTSGGASYLAVREFEMKLLLSGMKTDKARETLHQIQTNANYKNANAALKERWVVYQAYLEFLEHYMNDGNYKFSLSKFANEIPLVSQDKSGFNLAARILHILFHIGRNDLDNAMQHIESLRVYQARHLKDDSNTRSLLFIRLLTTMEKKSFNYKELHQLKEYQALKENYSTQIMHESEIIFYDVIWKMLVDVIRKNDQKLIRTLR
ncbi:MAG: hypothetical protein U0X41_00555 [Chitinophagales bacterium]